MAENTRLGTRSFLALLILLTVLAPVFGFACVPNETTRVEADPIWVQRLEKRLGKIDRQFDGELGVYVEDLSDGTVASLRADEYWYLASGIKVPVAIAILRMVDDGELTLDTELSLLESDYVDGAGPTKWRRPHSKLTVSYLLDQMLTLSDNTASDILIRVAGIDRVNQLAKELAPEGLGSATSLADVRRHTYSGFHEDAFNLSGKDFLILRNEADEQKRLAVLADLLKMDAGDFLLGDFDSAFRVYYETNLNAGTLKAYGSVLKGIVEGKPLERDSANYLLNLLTQVKTGQKRIKAGLPPSVKFAHKTGTQHRRACDLGIVISSAEAEARMRSLRRSPAAPPPLNDTVGVGDEETVETVPPRVVVNACTREFEVYAEAERALRAVGEAVAASGVLTELIEYTAGSDENE